MGAEPLVVGLTVGVGHAPLLLLCLSYPSWSSEMEKIEACILDCTWWQPPPWGISVAVLAHCPRD